MKVIKLTTPWNHNYLSKTPGNSGVFGNFKFEIDNGVRECDYWVVWGGLKRAQKVKCPADNIFFVTDEAHEQRKFNSDFLNQFAAVITQRKDVNHSTVLSTHDLGIWHFSSTYDQVLALQEVKKTKEISAVASDLTLLDGHKKRFAFINQLIGHYKKRIDFFGRGFSFLQDKADGLLPYKYSIAIENSYLPDYFTEKLFECFLCHTMPVYYGCPNLEDYFDSRAFLRIDISNLAQSIATIDDAVQYDIFRERLPFILEAKRVYMEKYLVFPALIQILSSYAGIKSSKKRLNVLNPEHQFGLSLPRKVINLARQTYKRIM
ncbi:MAG TPA: glycosyltransferase family 10 [Chryseosolibacter sp.]